MSLLRRIAPLAVLLVGASSASADIVLYQNDFETDSPLDHWSGNAHRAEHGNFSWFLGRYTNDDGVTLSIPAAKNLPDGKWALYSVKFDFYAIDSWDGENAAEGKDYFQFWANGGSLFSETFSNHLNGIQSFKGKPDVGPAHLGFNSAWLDSIYRAMVMKFEAKGADTLTLKWNSKGLLNISDESWGVDNITVSYTVIPSPGPLALVGLAGLVSLRRKR